MKYLLPGMESKERINLFLELTSIRSPETISALMAHFVDGLKAPRAAARYGIALQNFHRAASRLNNASHIVEKIKDIDWKNKSSEK